MMAYRYPLLAWVLLTACGAPSQESDEMDPLAVIEVATRWAGTFPCADCAGIRYDLALNPEAGRFQLLTTYLATADGDRAYERGGRYGWNETVICITPALPEPGGVLPVGGCEDPSQIGHGGQRHRIGPQLRPEACGMITATTEICGNPASASPHTRSCLLSLPRSCSRARSRFRRVPGCRPVRPHPH